MRRFLICMLVVALFGAPALGLEFVRQKNAATIIVFPIVDADGDFVTGAANLDSESDPFTDTVVPDGFADLTNEATEIGSTGIYYLALTAANMNFDYIPIQVKTSTAGAKTQLLLVRTMTGDPNAAATTTSGTTIVMDANTPGNVRGTVRKVDNGTDYADPALTTADTDDVMNQLGTFAAGTAASNIEALAASIGTPSVDLATDIAAIQGTHSTTVASVTSRSKFTLTAGWAVKDAYTNALITVTDASNNLRVERHITGYTANRLVILDAALPFTPEAGDVVSISGYLYPMVRGR